MNNHLYRLQWKRYILLALTTFVYFFGFSACTPKKDSTASTERSAIPTQITQATQEDDTDLSQVANDVVQEEIITPIVSLTVSSTIIVNEILTPTVTSDSSSSEQQKWQVIDSEISQQMAFRNNCQLPCWWGIEIGSSLMTARQTFDRINEDGWVESADLKGELQEVGFFEHNYRDANGDYLFSNFIINVLVKEDVIQVLNILLQPHVNSQPSSEQYEQINAFLQRDWQQYSVANVLEMFGKPELIYILPRNIADGDNFKYEFNLYYPSKGIVISYLAPLSKVETREIMCLDLTDLDSMQLYLYDPTVNLPNGYLQATYTLWPLGAELQPEDIALVESSDLRSRTGITIDEFFESISSNQENSACVELQG